MNGIKMSDCKFYVNKEERVVVCVIPNTRRMVSDFIHDHFSFNDIDFWYALETVDKVEMPCSFIGKAICAPEDEWNEELGRMIAFSRAKDKCYRSFFRRANTFVQLIDRRLSDVIEMLNDFGVKLSDKKDALEATIESKIQK